MRDRFVTLIACFAAIGTLGAGCGLYFDDQSEAQPGEDGPDVLFPEPDFCAAPGSAVDAFSCRVAPLLEASCAGCHSLDTGTEPRFVGASANESYEALVVPYPNALVSDDIDRSLILVRNGHYNADWTAEEREIIREWLAREALARGDGPQNSGDALERFAQCMSFAQWEALELGRLARQQDESGTECLTCHGSGLAAAFLSDDSAEMFEMHRIEPFIRNIVWATIDASGQYSVVPSQSYTNPELLGDAHPTFTEDPTLVDAVRLFVLNTYQRMLDGECQ